VTTLFGPFVLVPVLVTGNTTPYFLFAPRKLRMTVLVMGAIAIVVPTIFEWVRPASYAFVDGNIVVHPRAVAFPTATTFVAFATRASCGTWRMALRKTAPPTWRWSGSMVARSTGV